MKGQPDSTTEHVTVPRQLACGTASKVEQQSILRGIADAVNAYVLVPHLSVTQTLYLHPTW